MGLICVLKRTAHSGDRELLFSPGAVKVRNLKILTVKFPRSF